MNGNGTHKTNGDFDRGWDGVVVFQSEIFLLRGRFRVFWGLPESLKLDQPNDVTSGNFSLINQVSWISKLLSNTLDETSITWK